MPRSCPPPRRGAQAGQGQDGGRAHWLTAGLPAQGQELGQQLLETPLLPEPGRYLLLCNVPTGADARAFMNSTGPGQVTGGAPHHFHGMYAGITVQ